MNRRGVLVVQCSFELRESMAILTGFLFLCIFGDVLARQNSPNDVIWFPIEEIKNGYTSSFGEVFLTQRPNYGEYGNFDGRRRRDFRSVRDESRRNGFRSPGGRQADVIVFPDEEIQLSRDNVGDCVRSCPQTPEYNPVCGSDYSNYRNMGALKCSELCGKEVRFAHFGVCGKGLPLIFKPSPRPPKKRRIDDVNRDNW